MTDKQTIEVFVQGERIPEVQLLRVLRNSIVKDLIEKVDTTSPLRDQSVKPGLFLEDATEELNVAATLEDAGIAHRSRVHRHRCRRVEVTVNFKGDHKAVEFPTSTTVRKVKRWADDEFNLKGVDATEHALQICDTNKRPDEDVHIGSLVEFPNCKICFDLVPKTRVEG